MVSSQDSSIRLEKSPVVSPWLLAMGLSFLLLAIPAGQLATTLYFVGNRTDLTKAIWDGLAAQPVRAAVAGFALGQLLLHVGFAAAIVFLARLTARLWPSAASVNGFVVLWFAGFTAPVIGLNALWFPRSESGSHYHNLASTTVLGLPAAVWLAFLVGFLLFAVTMVAVVRLTRAGRLRHGAAIAALAVAGLSTVALGATITRARAAQDLPPETHHKPHVILLGVDSLRLQELARNGGTGKTPNLDAFLKEADIFTDVVTPVARTFPSWISILSGRPPRDTGAVFNLVPRDRIRVSPTLADVMRAKGYRTILATDEVRFSNIDESYGFDQLITPPVGAADFLMGRLTDLPLTNVVVNTWLGRRLFPYTYANRAAATLFRPSTYMRRLEAELNFDQPTLLVAHLCAAHWPYVVAGVPEDYEQRAHADDRPLYDFGLKTADSMFGELVAILERKGALNNALVVVLSDHGEGLAVPGDSLLPENQTEVVAGLQVPVKLMDWGHGQSVLSPVQYKVLLGFRSFGESVDYRASGQDLHLPATTMDIKPTLLDLLNIEPTGRFDYSVSLKSALLLQPDQNLDERLSRRARFTETDMRATVAEDGAIDEDALARENSVYFMVNRTNGRLELRPESFDILMAFKERAAIMGSLLLAALPADPDHHQYLLLDVASGTGRLVDVPPGEDEPEAHALWQQFHTAFAGELKPPTILDPDRVAATADQWQDFVLRHQRRIRANVPVATAMSLPEEPAAKH